MTAEVPVVCAVCGRHADRAEVVPDALSYSRTLNVACHGQVAVAVMPEQAIKFGRLQLGRAFEQDRRRGRSHARRKAEWT